MKMHKKVTWEKCNGRYMCIAKECRQWTENGCLLHKVGLICLDEECQFNISPTVGVHQCQCMDVVLDNNGHCLGRREKVKL